MERTLIILKPDAVQRGLIGTILNRFERRGLRFVGLKLIQMTPELAARHYAEHKEKPFYDKLIRFITSGPVVVGVLEGEKAIQVVRDTMGKTDPVLAKPGTIRADFGLEIGRNVVHGSAEAAAAVTEIALFFAEEELLSYSRAIDNWIHE